MAVPALLVHAVRAHGVSVRATTRAAAAASLPRRSDFRPSSSASNISRRGRTIHRARMCPTRTRTLPAGGRGHRRATAAAMAMAITQALGLGLGLGLGLATFRIRMQAAVAMPVHVLVASATDQTVSAVASVELDRSLAALPRLDRPLAMLMPRSIRYLLSRPDRRHRQIRPASPDGRRVPVNVPAESRTAIEFRL